jgi:hypothetical protein
VTSISADATNRSMPERARSHDRRRRAVPSISGQASTATASAPARVFETSEHRDTDSGQLLRLAAIRNAGPDDSHAMVRIAAHLPY